MSRGKRNARPGPQRKGYLPACAERSMCRNVILALSGRLFDSAIRRAGGTAGGAVVSEPGGPGPALMGSWACGQSGAAPVSVCVRRRLVL